MRKRLLTVKSLVFTMTMLFQLNSIFGQVFTLRNWTNVYHGISQDQLNLPFSVPAGSNTNRVLVVAVSSSKWMAGSISVTLSYGGQPLTLANGDMGTANVRQHTALYYLNEAGLDAAADQTLSATVSAGGATMVNTDIWAAVFDYVNQTSPLTDSRTYSSGTGQVTNFQFGTALTINAYNQAVEVVNSYNPQKTTLRTITYALNWTMVRDSTAFYSFGISAASIRNGVANRIIPNSVITDVSYTTFSGTAFASMTALSLNYEIPPPPTIQTSNITFSDITTSSFTINWTSGNGTNRIVLVKEGSAVDSDPVDGTTYTAGDLFGSGSQIGTGNYVVYNGNGYNVNVFNLNANTTYHVAVYEFSGPPGMEDYLMVPARGSQLTAPETAVTDDYRSNGSGNWGTAETWQTYDGSSWVTAGSPPNASSGLITLRRGHTITVAEAVTVDHVVVEDGAQLSVDSGVTLTIADGTGPVDCSIDGRLYNEGTVIPTGTLAFNSSSEYEHGRNGGTIPSATWDANSTCLITGITDSSPSGFGQNFGNFTWDCDLQSVTAGLNSNATVQSDFRLSGTGTGKLSITDSNNPYTLTISGNYFQTTGIFDLNSGAASSAVASLYAAGHFSFTGGSITETSPSGRGSVIFNGTGSMQTYTSGGTLSNTIDFTVSSGAYLQMGTGSSPSVISLSNGTFTLSSGATLGITSPQGITATTTGSNGGNIRVSGTRTFNTGAYYIYNGSVNQSTGDGLPLTVSSLVFNNSGGRVTFSPGRNTDITNDFSITAGSRANLGSGLIHSTSNLILGGTGQPAGSYGGATSGADYELPEYFEAATGIINNAPPAGTWLGVTSTDWNTASNWVGGIPTAQTTGTVPSYTAYQPVISGTTTALCNILTIRSGASLTITGSAEITTVENNGTMTVNPGGRATLTTLVNAGTLNLQSDAAGIASLIVTTYTNTNGAENIELFLTGGGDETNYPWHYISSPVEELSKAGVLSSGGDPEANDLAAYYENLVTNNKDLAWMGLDGWDYQNEVYNANYIREVLEVGRGYNYYSYYDAKRVFGGKLNTGNYQISLDCSVAGNEINGWNFLGNPFSSSIDWDEIAGSLPSGGEIENAIYFTRNNSLVSYVNGVGSGGDVTGNIPPMQGFFVKANASGQSVTLPASARVHSTQNRYKGNEESIPLIRLRIESDKISDETVIRFDEKAGNIFDPALDACKFSKKGPRISLWTQTGNISYSINTIPFPETETMIPVGVNISEAGSYKITAGQLQRIDNYNVYLTDKTTGFTINLRRTPALSFTASKGILENRFVIRISNISTEAENISISENIFNIYSSNGLINIEPLSDEWEGKKGSIGLIDMTGRVISSTDNAEFRKNSLIQIPSYGARGIYFVKIRSGVMRYVGKVAVR